MIKPVATINVVPNLPEPLKRLQELAYNLRWAWDRETIALFRRLDPEMWRATGHNPVWMLGLVSQERLKSAAEDPAFLAHLNRVCEAFDAYMKAENTWFEAQFNTIGPQPVIAYFSMEFGLAEAMQNYSGGLGVLSGDHLKSASDLGVPLVGMGLLYQEGYFHQYLNADGYQQESYPINDYSNLPVTLQLDKNGQPIKISVPMPGRELYAVIWKVQVGRVPLFLLDTNIEDNVLLEDRNLTDRLYGGDRRTRIRQEILMGIGGIRALDALGMRPTVCHMNEGHSAFLALERIRQLMVEHNISFYQAKEIARAANIFTTHTPVPAGLERFGFDLIDEHFTEYYQSLGLSRDEFIDLGRESMGDYELFSMAVLALNLSSAANGVAQLHGVVSRRMWRWMYPDVPEDEVPIGSITNGIHIQSWISEEMSTLFDRYLDPAWREEEARPEIWAAVDDIPDEELWRTHQRRRERLVAFARSRLSAQIENRGLPRREIEAAAEVLNPEALTIGFARRFATYKRATLIFRDIERLKRILNDPDRPVQIIFAGKAHPHDIGGKELIREIIHIARDEDLRDKIVFLENYDMNVARYLVQGVDVWLNNPRRPKEASGTSGMKVIYNGGLNVSILDGWWAEGYDPSVGWAIGNGEEYPEHEADHQDYVESEAIYNVLEQDIIPMFYQRGRDGLPREWISKIKNAMRVLAPFFNTDRMVQQYTERYYMPAHERLVEMKADNLKRGLAFSEWRSRIQNNWRQIRIESVSISDQQVMVGKEFTVEAVVHLGEFTPDDVRVQLYSGQLNSYREIGEDGGVAVDMQPGKKDSSGAYKFTARYTYHTSGERGLSVRVLPNHELLPTSFQPGLITWAHV
ncbi:MAG TPA: alpha-glucan family phosphorylase [Spirillospora sp.]|nr:alpha-glucan family phosphorylase [Spirillospora sp.]